MDTIRNKFNYEGNFNRYHFKTIDKLPINSNNRGRNNMRTSEYIRRHSLSLNNS